MTSNANNLLRALVVYAVVLPLALVLGYCSGGAGEYSEHTVVCDLWSSEPSVLRSFLSGITPLLFLAWNTTTVVFSSLADHNSGCSWLS